MVTDPRSEVALDLLLHRNGLPADSGTRISPSLEDVFVSYVRRAGGAMSG